MEQEVGTMIPSNMIYEILLRSDMEEIQKIM